MRVIKLLIGKDEIDFNKQNVITANIERVTINNVTLFIERSVEDERPSQIEDAGELDYCNYGG
jgi:hypothetical protein